MIRSAIVLAASLLCAVLVSPPAAQAACNTTQAVHTYQGGGINPILEFVDDGGLAVAADSCLTGDGDPDVGVSGGAFPADAQCLSYPLAVPHHADGTGASYFVVNLLALPISWDAGTDGQVPGLAFCTKDGIISDDATLEPNDCYAEGVNIGPAIVPAVLAPNVPSSNPQGDCIGADGLVWVFLEYGVQNTQLGLIVSMPITGVIWG